MGRLPNAAKRRESGSPGRQPWDRFEGQDKPRSGGRASESAAPAGLRCRCTRTPSACALGYVLTPLRGLGNRPISKFPGQSRMLTNNFRFPLLMAWRETRAAPGKFIFVVLSVALGAAALTAVTGFNESVRYTLLREARSLMAADIALRMPIEPSARELEFLDGLKSRGIDSTRVTETVSMASSGQGPPVLVSVKGADLGRYPFYGRIQLQPPNVQLDAGTVAVSDDLLLRLGLLVGDSIELGNRKFRIAARIMKEPD